MTSLLENQSDGSNGDLSAEPIGGAEANLAPMRTRVAELEAELRGLEQLRPLIAALQDQADSVGATLRRTEVRADRASTAAEQAQVQMERLSDSVGIALSVKKDVQELERLMPETKDRLGDLEALASDVVQRVAAFEQQRDAIDRALETAKSIDNIVQQTESLAVRQQDHAKTVAEFENTLQSLHDEVSERAAEIRSRQVQIDVQDQATLEELAAIRAAMRKSVDQVEFANREFNSVNQRVAKFRDELAHLETRFEPLEDSQRAVADVRSKADDLSERLSEIADDCSGLPALEARVADVKILHTDVLDRSEHIAVQQQEIEIGARAAREQLASIRDDVENSVERVEIANREFDSASQRTGDLCDALVDFERRMLSLDESRQSITDIQRDTDSLSARLSAISDDCRRLDLDAARVRSYRENVDRLDEAVHDVEQRVGHIEEVRAEVDAVSRDMADLNRTSDAITDALEQARLAHDEMTRMRGGQAETEKWLTDVQGSLEMLRDSVEDLNGMKPIIGSVREEAERVSSAMTAIDSRRALLEEIDKRLGELESLGARLDEGRQGPPPRLDVSQGGRRGWFFHTNWTFDKSTWEFGLQVRFAGRWKRGVAVWLGPVRCFIGWERRIGLREPEYESVEQLGENP